MVWLIWFGLDGFSVSSLTELIAIFNDSIDIVQQVFRCRLAIAAQNRRENIIVAVDTHLHTVLRLSQILAWLDHKIGQSSIRKVFALIFAFFFRDFLPIHWVFLETLIVTDVINILQCLNQTVLF